MKLSNRLEMVVSFVMPGHAAADVGTDHGHVPIELVRRGIVERAFAMDIRKGPLSKAEENIAAARIKEKIETRLSDGVRKLMPGEAESVIIAGMGGDLVIHILEDGQPLWGTVKQWVLSPHSELHKVREWLEHHGFRIVKEDMVFEEEKYYTILDVRPVETAGEGDTEAETLECCAAENHAACADAEEQYRKERQWRYGTHLIETKNPVFREFLKEEERKLEALRVNLEKQAENSARAQESLKDVEAKLSMNREVQHDM